MFMELNKTAYNVVPLCGYKLVTVKPGLHACMSLLFKIVITVSLCFATGKIRIQDILACGFLDDLLEVSPTLQTV